MSLSKNKATLGDYLFISVNILTESNNLSIKAEFSSKFAIDMLKFLDFSCLKGVIYNT